MKGLFKKSHESLKTIAACGFNLNVIFVIVANVDTNLFPRILFMVDLKILQSDWPKAFDPYLRN